MSSGPGIGRRAALGAALAGLAGCQQPPATPQVLTPHLAPDGTGYMALRAPTLPRTRDLFIDAANKLLEQKPRQIYVLVSSPGGVVPSALDIIAYMNRIQTERNMTFVTHNVGVVASAACYVFLAGQRRLSVPRGSFLFHAAGLAANGVLTGEVLQEASALLKEQEQTFHDMLRSRTRLTEGDLASFLHRTVILTPNEARRDGIIDTIADFTLPPGATIFDIRAAPVPSPSPSRPPAGA